MKLYIVMIAALWTMIGCEGLEPGSRVSGLRLLAVRADTPYASPGSTVHFQTLSYDTLGRPLSWGWGVCPDPTASTVLGCIDRLDWDSFRMADGANTYELAVSPDALEGRTPESRAQASIGVVVVVCAGELSAPAPHTKVVETGALPFTCLDRDTGSALSPMDVGVKRVFIREGEANSNPHIDGVTWDGVDWPEDEVKTVAACAQAGHDFDACSEMAHEIAPIVDGAAESGTTAGGDAFTEQVVVDYYTAGGVFERDVRIGRAPATRWALQRAGDAPSKIWIVVRDDRGGVTWTERTVLAP